MTSRRRSNPHADRPVHRTRGQHWRGNRVFYVAVEGESTEPDYLSYLNRVYGAEHQFLIHPLYRRNGMTPRQVVARAIEQGDEATADSRVQLWALFDRDQHRDVNQAIRDANAAGVKVGFSHPSFELWLLLHFVDACGQQNGSSRYVQARLRQCTGFETFAGSRNDKSIDARRFKALEGREENAAQRARRLIDNCPTDACSADEGHVTHCDPGRRDPSTDVYRLLAALGIIDA